jgi:hypothetical protein
MEFLRRYLDKRIADSLSAVFTQRARVTPPSGFSPASQFVDSSEWWQVVPFDGMPKLVKLRTLDAGEFPDVTLLECLRDKSAIPEFDAKVRFRNTLEYYCRHALVEPTFEFFEKEVWGKSGAVLEMQSALAELKKYAQTFELTDGQRDELQSLECSLGYCLPLDTMRAIAGVCEHLESVDTWRLSVDGLIVAYSLSQHYHNRASDNLNRTFLEHSRKNIDIAAAKLWHDKYGGKNR